MNCQWFVRRIVAFLFIFFAIPYFLLAIPPAPCNFINKYVAKVKTIYCKLGNSIIRLKTFQYGSAKDLVMINLHDDEMTSVIVAKKFLQANGGLLIKIENTNQRNINFWLADRSYTFDPNRMFSRRGISKSLEESGNVSDIAINEVEKFCKRILKLIPATPTCVIGLHNNTAAEFSITSYLPGSERATDAKQVYRNAFQDADDLFLTTDSLLYKQLSAAKYNVLWQDNTNAEKDGSLSIYCGEKNIRYLNCETQHGKVKQYTRMLTTASTYIERVNAEGILFSCKWRIPEKSNNKPAKDIYFGEKKVGIIKSVYSDSSGNFCSKVEIKKSFPLYSNADFFLYQYSNGNQKVEIRIDPTRKRKLVESMKDVIEVTVRKSSQ
jgi:hypothetical protein